MTHFEKLIDKYVTHISQYDNERIFCEHCGMGIYEGDTFYRYGRYLPKIFCEECRDCCYDAIEADIEEYGLQEDTETIISRCVSEL